MWQFWAALVIILVVVWYYLSHKENMVANMATIKYSDGTSETVTINRIYGGDDPADMAPSRLRNLMRWSSPSSISSNPIGSQLLISDGMFIVALYGGNRYAWSPRRREWLSEPQGF